LSFKAFTAVVVAGLCMSIAAVAAPLEAYGHLPSIEKASISPDGQKLGVIWTNGEERRIAIKDLTTGKIEVLGVGRAKVRDLDWAGPGHLLITTSTTAIISFVTAPRSEWFMCFDYNLATGKSKLLLADAEDSLNVIASAPQVRVVKGKPTIFVEGIHFVSGRGQDSLFSIDPETGKSTLVHAGFPNTVDWAVGPDGKPLAEAEYDQRTGAWVLKVASGAGWRRVTEVQAQLDRPRIVGLGRDGMSALIAEPRDDNIALHEVAPGAATWGEPFRVSPSASTIFDLTTHKLIGFGALHGDEQAYEFLDPVDTAAWGKIQRAYKGMNVELVSWSADRSRIVVLVQSPTDGPSYALIDFKTRRADPVGGLYQDLEPADISPVRPVRYKAKDGLEINGYLTTPNGKDLRNLPLVVLAHGGPAARDEPGFDWWSQALASRGYAVLRANFRGSDGYGAAFGVAGYGQWGRKMQTDLSDGVRDLARQGLIDPKRVCIVGASYGGYAALAGAAFDPGVYRCAASIAGPADLHRMVAWTKGHSGVAAQRYWTRFMGASDPQDKVLDEISPSEHADKITIPVLLIHGKDDTVVPLEQTRVMEKALREAGKPAEVVVMPGEDHWLSRGETRLQMLQSVVAFLEKNNPAP
jgi:dipeptidyl aminopeptidase/acylaminoacyl peptidase